MVNAGDKVKATIRIIDDVFTVEGTVKEINGEKALGTFSLNGDWVISLEILESRSIADWLIWLDKISVNNVTYDQILNAIAEKLDELGYKAPEDK